MISDGDRYITPRPRTAPAFDSHVRRANLSTVAINMLGGSAKICSSMTVTGKRPWNSHAALGQKNSNDATVARTPYSPSCREYARGMIAVPHQGHDSS